MYNPQITKERIGMLCKKRNIVIDQMLSELSLGVNAVRQISNARGMSSVNIMKIADYLNCSVDYLLGRTDAPNVNQGTVSNNKNNRTDNDELISLINRLSLVERSKIIVMINEMQNNKNIKEV